MADVFTYNGIKWKFGYLGNLLSMENWGSKKDVFIPSVFPNGQKINSISGSFCAGPFGKITISDDIDNIGSEAFYFACVDEVVWPSGCYFIPTACFSYSTVSKVSNIDHVMYIGDRAFFRSQIKTLDWPKGYGTIPSGTFSGSSIKKVNGLKYVDCVHADAFCDTTNLDFLDFSEAFSLELMKDSLRKVPVDKVVFPYYFDYDRKFVFGDEDDQLVS